MIQIVNAILERYHEISGSFFYHNGPAHNIHARFVEASVGVLNSPGLYFIYCPTVDTVINTNYINEVVNGIFYTLIYIGKAGMDLHGNLNLLQGIQKRLRNVGENNIRRSILWTNFMNHHNVDNLMFKWCETRANQLQHANPMYDNCAIIESELNQLSRNISGFRLNGCTL